MASLTGQEALALHQEALRRGAAQRESDLERAKARAELRRKQPFDFSVLEAMCDPSQLGGAGSAEERRAGFEYQYYVEYSRLTKMADFAQALNELALWT